MKIKEGYVLRKVADSYMAVPVGNEVNKLKGVIGLNETARRIWEELEEENSPQAVADKLKEEFDMPGEDIEQSVMEFIRQLQDKGLLD